jgi:hypothetical protein
MGMLFRERRLQVAVVICVVLLSAAWSYCLYLLTSEERAIAELKARGAGISTEAGAPWLPDTLREAWFTRATSISMLDWDLAPDDGALLRKLSGLKSLSIQTVAGSSPRIGGLSGLRHLTDVSLAGPAFDDTVVDSLNGLNLELLSLPDTNITARGLEELTRFSEIEWLDLSGTFVGDEHLPLLAKFPFLENLRLARTNVTDAGIPILLRLPALRYLSLSDSKSRKQVCSNCVQWRPASPFIVISRPCGPTVISMRPSPWRMRGSTGMPSRCSHG